MPQAATATPANPALDLVKEVATPPADMSVPTAAEVADVDEELNEDSELWEGMEKAAPANELETQPATPVPDASGQPAAAPVAASPSVVIPPAASTAPAVIEPTPVPVPAPSAAATPSDGQPSITDIDLFAAVETAPTAPAAAPASVSASQPPAQPQPTSPDRTAEYQRLREQALGQFEQQYAFTPEDTRQLMVEPEKVLPRVFARLHADIVTSVMAGLAQQLPTIMQSTRSVENERTVFNREFFKAWPQLADKKYVADIQGTLQVQRQLNPNLPMSDVIRNVGAVVVVKNQIPITSPTAASPAAPAGHQPVRPMNPGGGAAVPRPASGGSWADDMVKEFEDEVNG